jgi:hypothetical protein
MKVILMTLILFCLVTSGSSIGYETSLEFGYKGGPALQMGGMISDFADELPVLVQGSLAYTSLNPGKAADARRIFINNATNGDPQKSGRIWDFRLDFLYKVDWLSLSRAYLYAGPRYALFLGNFKYIGGNEDFDITSSQWGLGTGLKSFFTINRRLDFILSGGFDYYFANVLGGHDTSYSPDGEHVNPREDYGFKDADEAVNQPKLQFRMMFGINYHL